MSDKNWIEMTSTEFVTYVKRCPQKHLHELPDKLDEWCKNKSIVQVLERMKTDKVVLQESTAEIFPALKQGGDLRYQITKDILVRHAPNSATNVETLVDYAVEVADTLLERLNKDK